MTKILYLCILLILFVENVKASRILAVFPTPSISHQVVFRPLIHELVRRGHEVTVITTDPAFPPGQAPQNLTEINVHDISYKLWQEEFFKQTVEKGDNMENQITVTLRLAMKVVVTQLKTKEVQDIITKKKGEFDLLLLEAYVLPVMIYSHFIKAPVILVSSLGGIKYNFRAVGAPTHPLLYPTMLHKRLYNLTNWEKLEQLYDHWCIESIFTKIASEGDEIFKSMFGPSVPSILDLTNNVHMLFINMNPIWVDNQPVPTNVVYIGGIHMNKPKELPKDLQNYLDSSKNGVVYFSLGTNVITSDLPPEFIQMIVRVLSELPFNVLLKWDKDLQLPENVNNIKIFQWLPQFDVLRHPNVKVFITQGGIQSTDEAISAGVPLIGIPFIVDQWYNVQKYVHHKIGVQLNVASLTEDDFRKAIETVTGDKSYRENILRLRALMSDQPQSPLERAVWWTEHVLRHGGAAHLRAIGANITWTDYLELELVLYVLSILAVVLTILSTSVYILCKTIRQKLKPKTKRKAN